MGGGKLIMNKKAATAIRKSIQTEVVNRMYEQIRVNKEMIKHNHSNKVALWR